MLSIVTINYNNAKGLLETLRSIEKQICFYRFEHIIIDGGSKDSSVNHIKNYVHKKQMLSGYLRKMQEFIYSIIVIGTLLYLPFKIVFDNNKFNVMLYTLIFAILAPKLVSTNIGMSKELLIFLSIYLTNKNYLLRS